MSIIPNWHPLLVHFPIVLLITSLAFFAAAMFRKGKPLSLKLYQAGLYNLWLVALAALFTAATGWYAFQTVNHDEAGHLAISIHMRWAFATLALSIMAVSVTLFKRYRSRRAVLVFALRCYQPAPAVTVYLGGEYIFRYGIGVMRVPTEGFHYSHTNMGNDHDHHHE